MYWLKIIFIPCYFEEDILISLIKGDTCYGNEVLQVHSLVDLRSYWIL